MAMRRRAILEGGVLVGVASLIPQALLAQSTVASDPTEVAQAAPALWWMDRASLTAQVRSRFRVQAGSTVANIKLLEVADLPGHAGSPDAFAARFTGGLNLRQDVYTFNHPTLGQFEALMVPVERPVRLTQKYEVVVNRVSA